MTELRNWYSLIACILFQLLHHPLLTVRCLIILMLNNTWFNAVVVVCFICCPQRDGERKSISTEQTFRELAQPRDLLTKCQELCQLLSADLKREQCLVRVVACDCLARVVLCDCVERVVLCDCLVRVVLCDCLVIVGLCDCFCCLCARFKLIGQSTKCHLHDRGSLRWISSILLSLALSLSHPSSDIIMLLYRCLTFAWLLGHGQL